MWDLSEYKSIFTGVVSKNSHGSSCCIAGDDGSIVSGWRDGFIRSFDASGRILWEIASAHRGSVTSIYCDANYVLSGGEDGAVRVWARTNRKLLIQFNGKSLAEDIVSYRPEEGHREPISRYSQALPHPFMLNGPLNLNLRP